MTYFTNIIQASVGIFHFIFKHAKNGINAYVILSTIKK